MKSKMVMSIAITIVTIICFSISNIFAQTEVKSTGIGFRASYWSMTDKPTQIIVSDYGENTMVNIGGAGAWIYFFSRINYNAFLEFSLGGIAKVKVEEKTGSYNDENVDVFVITPLLLGMRYDLLSPHSKSALQPYVSFGAGPYWMTSINVREQAFEDEVSVNTKLKRGAYVGGGFNFILSRWLAVNFDVKYHIINFKVKHEHSGFEYGLGVNFMWGRYKPEN